MKDLHFKNYLVKLLENNCGPQIQHFKTLSFVWKQTKQNKQMDFFALIIMSLVTFLEVSIFPGHSKGKIQCTTTAIQTS